MRSTSTDTVHHLHPHPTLPSHGHYKKPPLAGVAQSCHQLHQTSTMKFVALALTLLLAVGSHAASVAADPPTQLAHARAALDVYLQQVKDSAQKAVAQLDDAEYRELKVTLTQRLDDMSEQIKTLQGVVSPVTDSVVTTISDATADLRASIVTDIDALKAQVQADRDKLDAVIKKHIDEYHTLLDPVIKEYQEKHTVEMAALKIKMDPVVQQLKEKIAVNVEETKKALEPIVEAVRAKLTERLESLKEVVVPYVEDYKEQLKHVYDQAQAVDSTQLDAVRAKITPFTENIKTNLQQIFAVLTEAFSPKE